MHYHAEVWIPSLDDDGYEHFYKTMEPFQDVEFMHQGSGEKNARPDVFFDWFGIGCRWSGIHYDGNIIPVSKAPKDLTCASLVINDVVFHCKERYSPDRGDYEWHGLNVREKLESLGITDGYLVTVDYHM